jgi:2-hydroxychromene-2-carboxylate isomerase
MGEQFREQGGAATMDPSRWRRWLTSRFVTTFSSERRIRKIEAGAERARIKAGLPHQLEYFHQVDDAYSHLAAQALAPILARYGVTLLPHLVAGPRGANLPEPDLLPALGRYDAALVAPHYQLEFPPQAEAPAPGLILKANRILAGVTATDFAAAAVAVGEALWAADAPALEKLVDQFGQVSESVAEQAVSTGTARRKQLKHYSGAMFFYGDQWYWGVDRLYHLERRWQALGLGKPGELLYPRPAIEAGSYQDNGSLTLEVYVSLRSPYTAVIFDKAVELANHTGVRLELRPVLPMVMRGVPATREKGMYIFSDAAREARALGLDFGKMYDPIGAPVRRAYSLYSWADGQGKAVALISEFLQAAFYLGINTNRDSGLRKVVERAGLSWSEAQSVIDNDDWQPLLEQNRLAMYGFGSWGVPTFRLLDARGNTVVWAWGQDRLWLIAREIQRLLVQA